ncbi:hypothetical protein GUITHDRAFT_165245 [Guillardia theta CCMP2712]|uniref:Cyclic nucleotide-binding domain-containing protein n=1 Tax=Guillardia theta (strain CCMP2712) TaxID=905079 RepID=L1IQ48_GUITC|nr:hypothetical protein GUITHDRAFT_165245 [Guillardia theta CCMP2712]EKX38406.1 hypothetical protein GUITHDRAFT_165245 [Guillardia theta CCMP2712]|eukprot:XP_005825386.1 hypothetical protein GUITHDRAFT_165245 [Guillardia theta CCMP2712]
MAREGINKGTTRLRLIVREAKNLYRSSNAPCNASCLVRLFSKNSGIYQERDEDEYTRSIFRSAVELETSNPLWNQVCEWDMDGKENAMIEISLWDSGALPEHGNLSLCIGQAVINVAKLSFPMHAKRYELDVHVRRSFASPKAKVLVEIDYSLFPSDGGENAKNMLKLPRDEFSHSQKRLCQRLKLVSYETEERIVEAGTPGTSVYFIVSGQCAVAISGKVVAKLNAGDYFGEVAMLLSETRTADIFSLTNCELLELTNTDLWDVINEYPTSGNHMYMSLKRTAVASMKRNIGAMCVVESHPSAMESNMDPLSALNSTDRRRRVAQWREIYESDKPIPDQISEFPDVVDDSVDPMAEAMKISGVGQQVVNVIRNMKLFIGAPLRAQAQVVARLKSIIYEQGDTIIQAGDIGTCMYIINNGKAEVIVDDKRVAELATGTFFGEVALMGNQKRTATVKAMTKCELLQLDQDDVWTVFNMFPSMYKTLTEVAEARIKKAQQEFESPDPNSKSSENDTWKDKLRKQKRGIFRVKFRAPFDKFTPEEIGSTQRLSFSATFSHVKLSCHTCSSACMACKSRFAAKI